MSWGAQREWTPAEDAFVRANWFSLSLVAMGRAIGVTHATVLHRGTRVLDLPWPRERETTPPADPAEDMDLDRDPLPAGHPMSWGLITAGTCLAGTLYPEPC
jgi:hypothetical protein